ncbi:hypothetical protein WJ97_13810 [Burkholderia ubonensis]|nr:hypothetical protein WJ97_13810 [Burkholderia ubonensis]
MRVPPTERKGRVHTSTVTVAVFEGHLEPQQNTAIPSKDILERVTKGTGPGGQNRNKRETAIVLRHIPTGIEVKAEAERTQEGNRRVAMATLQVRVAEHLARTAKQQVDHLRKTMLGLGERSDKIRTYRTDGATDHRTSKKAPLKQIEAGNLSLLW